MGGHQSRLAGVPSSDGLRKLEKGGPQNQHEFGDQPAEDTDLDTLDVVLSRSDVEAWGFAWNVSAHASQRLVIAGVDPRSPAGRWNKAQQESRLRPICRGDELLEVNGVSAHDAMRRELVAALVARLLFRRPIQEEEELAAAVTAAALARQRRVARERSAAALADSRLWLSSHDRPNRAERMPRQSVCVKNTFIHMKCDSDPGDDGARTPDSQSSRCPEGQLSLSDPLPRPSGNGHMSPSKLSDAGGHSDDSFSSARSGTSKISQSSGERRPSSREGGSCPSTDWEFQAYQGHVDQASGSQARNQWHMQPGHVVHPSAPAMVPMLVPVVGVQPGQPVFAMQPVAAGIGVPMTIPLPTCQSNMPLAVQAAGCGLQTAAQPEGSSATRVVPEHAPPPPNYPPPTQSRKQSRQAAPTPPPAYRPYEEDNAEEAARHGCSAASGHKRCEATAMAGPAASEQHHVREQLSGDTKLADISEHPNQATAEPRKKKPTRRGGKRARHRPCHVAAAASDWASSIGSIETPSFGDLGSGEEAEGEADSEAEVQVDHSGNPSISRSIPEAPSANLPKRSFYPPAGRLKIAAGLAPLADRVRGRERETLEDTKNITRTECASRRQSAPLADRERGRERDTLEDTTNITRTECASRRQSAPLADRVRARERETLEVREQTKAEAELLRYKPECPTFGRSLDISAAIMRASPTSFKGAAKEFDNEAEDSHGEAIDEVEPEPASASDRSDPPSTMASAAQKATATSASLGLSPVGTASSATAPEGWPLPKCAIAKDGDKVPEVVEARPPAQPDDASETIVGRRAQVIGLVRTPEYNGQWGQVQDFDPNLGRYNVNLIASDGPPVIVKLRRENLYIPKAVFLRFEADAKSEKPHQSSRAAEAAGPVVRKPAAGERGWRPTLRLNEK
eukprot:TRINITY_DN4055_c0_g1_i2.p1 TRINITY_DN4055_c0_g1~~TRINITY_DN4055_c0_g1_i2.p1  ORF type:complete len:910 (-),score=137.55 TRINITY_DN4055_c0_g1_i2:53-2782(-)